MRGKLNEVRSDALQSNLSTLQNNLKRDVDRLEKLQVEKTSHELSVPSNSNANWSDSYKQWKEWEDESEDELQGRIERTRQRLSKLSSKSKDSKEGGNSRRRQICCPGSQFRDSERIVARMSLSERLKKMEAFCQVHGNRCFKKGDFVSALKWYEKSLLYYEYCLPTKKQEREAADKERELSLTNSAACHLGLTNYRQCIDCCTEALEVANGESIKALYRRAKAYRFMCDFERAMSDLEKAKRITGSDNKAANALQNILHDEHCTLQAAILSYREDSKIAAKKMMQSTD